MNGDRGLLGAGSQANETAEFDSTHRFVFRAVDLGGDNGARDPQLIDISNPTAVQRDTPVTAAVGAPGLRRALVDRWPGESYHSVIADSAWISPSAVVGAGSTVAPGAVITARASVGEHVIINVGATVSHNCEIGDFATVSPGAHIAGDCIIGAGVFIGIGAIVTHGVRIAAGAVIGAGAVVLGDIESAGVWVGVPARHVRELDSWIMRL